MMRYIVLPGNLNNKISFLEYDAILLAKFLVKAMQMI